MEDQTSKNLPPTKFNLHKILKIQEFCFENPQSLFLFYNVYKEKMFTIEIEDGHEVP